jgi:hypothetical protein
MAVVALMGLHEVAAFLGISRQAVRNRRQARFGILLPEPLAELRCGPVWDAAEIEAYAEVRRRDPRAGHRVANRRRR